MAPKTTIKPIEVTHSIKGEAQRFQKTFTGIIAFEMTLNHENGEVIDSAEVKSISEEILDAISDMVENDADGFISKATINIKEVK